MKTAHEAIAAMKAEIERRIAEYDKWIEEHPIQAGGSPIRERREELASLKENFIDTLSEEPDKSLEEEVKNYFQGYWPGTETAEQCNTDLHFTPPSIIRIARHFVKWGAEHLKK